MDVELLKKEYSRKNDIIKKRLKDFKNIKEDEWFYELCFCILTPQSSAKKADAAIEELKGLRFKERNINPAPYLIKNTRFHNNKGKYLLEMKEKYSELRKELDKINDDKEKREFLVENVKGLGLKEASLPYDEKVLIIIKDRVKLIGIGELYDKYHDSAEQIKTFAFNHSNLKFEICSATKIMRHNYKKDLYEIKLTTGRKTKITGDHSVFTVKNGKLIEAEVRNLKEGEFIAIPNSLKHSEFLPERLNIVKEFIDKDVVNSFYLRSKSYVMYLRDNFHKQILRKNQYTQNFRGIISMHMLKKLPKEAYSIKVLEKHNVVIGTRRSNTFLKSVINLDEDFFWILGILMAEAYIKKNPIEFTLGLEELDRHKKLNFLLKYVFGVRVKSYKPKKKNVYTSKVHSKPFFYFIKYILGIKGTATTKNFPEVVYSASKDKIISFLQGYWEGDGWKKSKSYMSISTTSKELANGILLSLLMIGVIGRHCIKKRNNTLNNTIDVSGIIQPNDLKNHKFINKIEAVPSIGDLLHKIHKDLKIISKVDGKHTYLFNKVMRNKHINDSSKEGLKKIISLLEPYGTTDDLESLKKIAYSDLSFVKIKEIKKEKYSKKYVYDLEVSDKDDKYENFVGGFGGVCLHNSHFLRNTGHENLAILDRHILKNLIKLNVIKEIPKTLTPKAYLDIEERFKRFSDKAGIGMDELDLLFWSMETGEVFK